MTKSLKGLSGRSFSTSTSEEFLGGHQLAGLVEPAGIVQPLELVQPVDFLGSRMSFAARGTRASEKLVLQG